MALERRSTPNKPGKPGKQTLQPAHHPKPTRTTQSSGAERAERRRSRKESITPADIHIEDSTSTLKRPKNLKMDGESMCRESDATARRSSRTPKPSLKIRDAAATTAATQSREVKTSKGQTATDADTDVGSTVSARKPSREAKKSKVAFDADTYIESSTSARKPSRKAKMSNIGREGIDVARDLTCMRKLASTSTNTTATQPRGPKKSPANADTNVETSVRTRKRPHSRDTQSRAAEKSKTDRDTSTVCSTGMPKLSRSNTNAAAARATSQSRSLKTGKHKADAVNLTGTQKPSRSSTSAAATHSRVRKKSTTDGDTDIESSKPSRSNNSAAGSQSRGLKTGKHKADVVDLTSMRKPSCSSNSSAATSKLRAVHKSKVGGEADTDAGISTTTHKRLYSRHMRPQTRASKKQKTGRGPASESVEMEDVQMEDAGVGDTDDREEEQVEVDAADEESSEDEDAEMASEDDDSELAKQDKGKRKWPSPPPLPHYLSSSGSSSSSPSSPSSSSSSDDDGNADDEYAAMDDEDEEETSTIINAIDYTTRSLTAGQPILATTTFRVLTYLNGENIGISALREAHARGIAQLVFMSPIAEAYDIGIESKHTTMLMWTEKGTAVDPHWWVGKIKAQIAAGPFASEADVKRKEKAIQEKEAHYKKRQKATSAKGRKYRGMVKIPP
ncbi:hypothetical protein K432DRAFT_408723 [Lepidopterella palustris CBS 459.81]|uniref:Uncharacterized protein n=1 Tax=Lepidopterella palustris CBS 459.81 TaxID=1314670 RepID=A0A8E2E1U3_9PEZI|nr:hypothetical protein K432DRAFT_408723 [Lepidopterella palustris CBS 459.81]